MALGESFRSSNDDWRHPGADFGLSDTSMRGSKALSRHSGLSTRSGFSAAVWSAEGSGRGSLESRVSTVSFVYSAEATAAPPAPTTLSRPILPQRHPPRPVVPKKLRRYLRRPPSSHQRSPSPTKPPRENQRALQMSVTTPSVPPVPSLDQPRLRLYKRLGFTPKTTLVQHTSPCSPEIPP